jgi:hypothetical protein
MAENQQRENANRKTPFLKPGPSQANGKTGEIDRLGKVDASRSVNPGIGDGGGKKHTDKHGRRISLVTG